MRLFYDVSYEYGGCSSERLGFATYTGRDMVKSMFFFLNFAPFNRLFMKKIKLERIS